jgi:hypothetical protein
VAVAGTDELSPAFAAAVALNAGAVSLLIAADALEIQELSARWPLFSEPGWLVGSQTDLARLQQAYEDAAVAAGAKLRILIARDLALASALGREWPRQ